MNQYFFEVFHSMPRQGPGNDASTLRALATLRPLLPETPASPRTLDLGCGSGASTLCLAQAGLQDITAVDIDAVQLARLDERARALGLEGRIRTHAASMAELPFAEGSFELVWSEGALYSMGFENALRELRCFLAPSGCMAASELVWTVESPPQGAVDFLSEEYPDIRSATERVIQAQSLGWNLVDSFELPSQLAWGENYYAHMTPALHALRQKYPGNAEAEETAAMLENEVRVWQDWGRSWNYMFLLLQYAP